jgi:hypothetical protein
LGEKLAGILATIRRRCRHCRRREKEELHGGVGTGIAAANRTLERASRGSIQRPINCVPKAPKTHGCWIAIPKLKLFIHNEIML